MQKILFWLNCARVYSLPVTILNWLVVFVYSVKQGGNILCGLIALFGISLVHMATNLIDDYFDYKILSKDEAFLSSAQNCKCKYLRDNLASVKDLKHAIISFLFVAACTGVILFFLSGIYVVLFALIALIVAITYQKLSLKGLGEISVIFTYGPLLYLSVYYVMTGMFSYEVLILSLAASFFTNTLLYTHMLMDFDGDECSHKTTLCRKFKTKENALRFILFFYAVSYLSLLLLSFQNPYYLLGFIVLPLIFDLYKSLYEFNKDKTNLPEIKFWHQPLENWDKISLTSDAPFYFRFFYSRNIATYFLLLLVVGILLK